MLTMKVLPLSFVGMLVSVWGGAEALDPAYRASERRRPSLLERLSTIGEKRES